ncbi:MAG: alpha/beta fold hydrolase [Chloroflexi bacterium]|nr:alpha/beta fold hydrolase [Chloroflexota bacterium]
MRRDVEFKSKGVTCRGWLMTPDSGSGPYPAVVMAGGWCYVKEIVMPHYAEYLVQAGLATLLFDYRCFGASDGEPRQHLNPWDQIEDYKNAVSFLGTQPEVDSERIGVWGISYSGGHVLIVGATDPRVKCIVSNVAVVDGYQNMRRAHGERKYIQLMQLIREDRERRFADPSQAGYIPMSSLDPDNELSAWPYPDVYEIFMDIKEREAPRHEHRNTIESVELLLDYVVAPYARRILNTPTLMVVAANDDKTLWDLEIDVFNQIPAPNKKLAVLPTITHMSLYSRQSHLAIAGQAAAEWLSQHLVQAPVRVGV